MRGELVECCPARLIVHGPPVGAARQASKLSADDILQHRFVDRQIGHDLLQLPVLLFVLAQLLHLGGQQAAVFIGLIIKGRFADTSLAADLAKLSSLPQLAAE